MTTIKISRSTHASVSYFLLKKLSITKTPVSDCCQFSDIDINISISQGSVSACRVGSLMINLVQINC